MSAQVVERFYDRFAGVYDLLFDQVFREGRRAAIDAMCLEPGSKALEVGVGTGLNLPLYPRGVNVVGIDLSMPMLVEAHARGRVGRDERDVGLMRMNAGRLAFADGAFDGVCAPYVASVVPDAGRLVREMSRVCRPGGRVVLVNHFESRHPIGSWIERSLTPLAHHVGFRLDLPIESVKAEPRLELLDERRVNAFGLWRLLVFRRSG